MTPFYAVHEINKNSDMYRKQHYVLPGPFPGLTPAPRPPLKDKDKLLSTISQAITLHLKDANPHLYQGKSIPCLICKMKEFIILDI